MAKDCPLRHSRGCPACGGECPSLRSCKTSYIHRASKGPGMPSARKAEEQRPFIDLRSPTEGSEVTETKKENASSQHYAALGGHVCCLPRSQVRQWMADQTNASPRGRTSRHKREGHPGRKSHLHNRFPTTLQRKQQRRGPSKPGETNGLSRPRHVPRTPKAAPPLC